jgi:hypothetical protein
MELERYRTELKWTIITALCIIQTVIIHAGDGASDSI